jgi:glycosyltransferase involved in cell wall biosynthesis
VVHFHALTLGAGNDHAECCRQENIPYVITYHTPAMSCARGTLLRWGTEPCDGRIDPRRCAACCLEGRGWSKYLARLVAFSPLGQRVLPDSPFTTSFALPSLLQESKACWSQFFRGASHVIACAEFCRDVLVVNGVPATQITIQRQALPGIDRERKLRLPLPVRSGRPIRLGFFGRITAVKGPDLLSPTVKRLQSAGIAATGECVGPIEGDPRWAERLFASGAPEVQYAGVKRGNDLRAWIRSCDLVVIPSRWMETGPLTLLEAWDQGTPVIGADRGGLRDFMTSAGLTECLFGPDSPAEMAAAVNRMLGWNGPAPAVFVPGMRSLAARMIEVYTHARDPAADRSHGKSW